MNLSLQALISTIILMLIFGTVLGNICKFLDIECNEFFVKTAVYSGLWKLIPNTKIIYNETNTVITDFAKGTETFTKQPINELEEVVVISFRYVKGQTLKNGIKIEPIVFKIQ